jgi:NAD(P)-dependent dehydrogenase (short-subunit alcohol dehydrogenase family)
MRSLNAPGSRVVSLSSAAHRNGGFDVHDLNWTARQYSLWGVYAGTKLCNILFAKELQRRLEEKPGNNVTAVSLHPVRNFFCLEERRRGVTFLSFFFLLFTYLIKQCWVAEFLAPLT